MTASNAPFTLIAIDPDVDNYGWAEITEPTPDSPHPYVVLRAPTFTQMVALAQELYHSSRSFAVIIEAGWVTQHFHHLGHHDRPALAAAKGYSVGRNHEAGHKAVQLFQAFSIPVHEVTPLQKCWHGRDGKITQTEIERIIPHFPRRSSQDQRDAALLAFTHFKQFQQQACKQNAPKTPKPYKLK